jgi:hypothetical protein
MRISVSSWATTDGDVERALRAMLAIAQQTRRDFTGSALQSVGDGRPNQDGRH